jgi:hypothetical protein
MLVPDRVVPDGLADGDDRIRPPASQGVEEALGRPEAGQEIREDPPPGDQNGKPRHRSDESRHAVRIEHPGIDDVVSRPAELGSEPQHVPEPADHVKSAVPATPAEHPNLGTGSYCGGRQRAGLPEQHEFDFEPVLRQPLGQSDRLALGSPGVENIQEIGHAERSAAAHRRTPLRSASSS